MQSLLPVIIQTKTLEQLLAQDAVVIIEVGAEEAYMQGHVPGAVHCDYNILLQGTEPVPNKVAESSRLQACFSRLGITPDKHVVAYDRDAGVSAARLLWTLDLMGHHAYSLLDGGWYAWEQEQLPVDDALPEISAMTAASAWFVTAYHADVRITREELMLLAAQKTQHKDAAMPVIWDVRSRAEYAGLDKRSARAGHIPGALHYEWKRALGADLKIRPKQQLLAELQHSGLHPKQETIVYCQTHRRSAFVFVLAKYLGFSKVRGYDGSWNEWGNCQDTPIQT